MNNCREVCHCHWHHKSLEVLGLHPSASTYSVALNMQVFASVSMHAKSCDPSHRLILFAHVPNSRSYKSYHARKSS